MTGNKPDRSGPPAPCGPLRGRGRHEGEPELEGAARQAASHAAAELKTLSPSQAWHASCKRRGVAKNQLDTASPFQRWLPLAFARREPRGSTCPLLLPTASTACPWLPLFGFALVPGNVTGQDRGPF